MSSVSAARMRPAAARRTNAALITARFMMTSLLNLRQRDTALRLVLAFFIAVRHRARLVALKEEDLGDALVRVNLCGERRRIRDFNRHMALPFRLERRDVDDDPAAGVGGLAEADRQDVPRNPEVLDRA